MVEGSGSNPRVPHYEQQFPFTCGPACLMMVFKHFDGAYRLDRANEVDLWRESSLAPIPATSRYGLAFAALTRGYRVKILTTVAGIELKPRPGDRASSQWMRWAGQMMRVQFEERKARTKRLGLEERKVKRIGTSHVLKSLKGGGLAVMLTSARFFDDEDWAHWVVVTGSEGGKVFVNDPASPPAKGHRVFDTERFVEINGYYGNQVLISLSR